MVCLCLGRLQRQWVWSENVVEGKSNFGLDVKAECRWCAQIKSNVFPLILTRVMGRRLTFFYV